MTHSSGLVTIPVQERLQSFLFQREAHACHTYMFLKEPTPSSLNTVNLIKSKVMVDLSGAYHGPKFNSLWPNKTLIIHSKLELAQLTITFSLVSVSPLFSLACQIKMISLTSFTELVSINLMNNSKLPSLKEWEYWSEEKLILRCTTLKVQLTLMPWEISWMTCSKTKVLNSLTSSSLKCRSQKKSSNHLTKRLSSDHWMSWRERSITTKWNLLMMMKNFKLLNKEDMSKEIASTRISPSNWLLKRENLKPSEPMPRN